MNAATFTITGDVNVSVTITENLDGTLTFDLAVLDDTGSIGDLNALFFDVNDDGLANGLTVTGDDVTGTAFKADGVTKVDGYTNMNGEVVKELGKFDGGVQFGTSGIGSDDIRATSFTLSHDTQTLTLADFSLQDFGVRLTSVGAEDGSREGSLKLGGTAPVLEPQEPPSANAAVDDTMTVFENEDFGGRLTPDGFVFENDPLDSGEISLLANDTTDGGAYLGAATSVNGSADDLGEIVLGSDGGAIRVFADGTVDFSSYSNFETNDFAGLNTGESRETTFEYGIEGGDTATLTVTVLGMTDGDDGGFGGPVG